VVPYLQAHLCLLLGKSQGTVELLPVPECSIVQRPLGIGEAGSRSWRQGLLCQRQLPLPLTDIIITSIDGGAAAIRRNGCGCWLLVDGVMGVLCSVLLQSFTQRIFHLSGDLRVLLKSVQKGRQPQARGVPKLEAFLFGARCSNGLWISQSHPSTTLGQCITIG